MQTILRLNKFIYTSSDDFSKPLLEIISKKNNINFYVLKTLNIKKRNYFKKPKKVLWNFLLWFYKFKLGGLEDFSQKRILSLYLFQDMVSLYLTWRRIKGYPIKGQRTWSNGKNASTNGKILHAFRLKQFLTAFGGKKRLNFSTLILAEYTNKFWMYFFTSEWLQARKALKKNLHKKTKNLQIDLINLSKGITAGYKRKGAAAKQAKAKKQTKSATVGLPLFFSRFMYNNITTRKFPFKITVEQQQKKIMKGMKRKKKVIKKKK